MSSSDSAEAHSPADRRPLNAVLGPTNTGKTHYAIGRMLGHASGVIGLPLRLLAREVYDRVVAEKGAGAVALVTGEEKIVPASPSYWVCTVESMPAGIGADFVAIDEIQLAQDPERGHVFTDRLLHARGANETLVLGSDTMRTIIQRLVPHARFLSRPRYSDLAYTGPRKLTRLPRRSAIVAFSAEQVYAIAELVRRQRGGAAVVMGALSPRTRNAQVALYQSGEVDFLVATDAIGMGLNMDVDHVAFAATEKFDGIGIRPLRAHELAQIAGRAGRYLNDGTFGTTGDAPPFEEELIGQIESHRFDPVRVLQWRNAELGFATIETLIDSLERGAPARGLVKTRAQADVETLKRLAEDTAVREKAGAPAGVKRLWEVCQIPDFRKTAIDEHVRLVAQIFGHLSGPQERIPDDWLEGQLSRLESDEGDVDALAARLSHVRTWAYCANRPGWLADPAEWQGRTRAIEDRLSDALHERLIQRFIDRRTSVLMRRLREDEELVAAIEGDGEVMVEGEYVGRLQGFRFVPDPRAQGVHGRALRAAALKGLAGEIAARAGRLASAPDGAFGLSEHGQIWWEGAPVARLVKGAEPLKPQLKLLSDELLESAMRSAIEARLQGFLAAHVTKHLGPLAEMAAAVADTQSALAPGDRGMAFRLIEGLGNVARAGVAAEVKALDQEARARLRRFGVRFGEFNLFLPALLKPAPGHLAALLWAVHAGLDEIPPPPQPGLTSGLAEPGVAEGFYGAAGFRVLGGRFVRLDMLERLADLIRPERPKMPAAPVAKSEPGAQTPAGLPPADPPQADHPGTEETPVPAAAPAETAPGTVTAPSDEPAASSPDAGPAAAEAAPPKPDLPPGSFVMSPAMMSILGCSEPELAQVLRALGFRAREDDDGAGGTRLVWRRKHVREGAPKRPRGKRTDAGPRPPRRDAKPANGDGPRPARPQRTDRPDQAAHKGGRPRGQGPGGKGGGKGGGRGAPRPQSPAEPRRAPRERPADPNSPFAALMAIRDKLTPKS